jgi:8-oxo-dGTP pyrophosphatase MutT (NUDIX family)
VKFEDSLLGRIRQVWGSQYIIYPGAGVVLENAAGEVLLVQRAYDRRWQFPAGFMEQGESIEDTARRECAEELGIVPQDLACFGIISRADVATMTYPNGDTVHNLGVCFCARRWTGTLHLRDAENIDARFFSPSALPEAIIGASRQMTERFAVYRATGVFQMF